MTWIQTYTGKKFNVFDPDSDSICIEDIAHSLSLQCRFNGHCKEFYSVAEHCVRMVNEAHRVYKEYTPQLGFMLLLHDASEAYLCDIPRPIKHSEEFERYRILEGNLEMIIYGKFGLSINHILENRSIVNHYDNRILVTEARDLLSKPPEDWQIVKEYQPFAGIIDPVAPVIAEKAYLQMFEHLQKLISGAE
ncbi:MAG TPA: hypothetical protein VHO03_16600 [Ignavibacteriales bacterium]|nr:hypothetical protein [Ignavibacteriales bacterium]